jgi:2-polyprenyl-3-methyl-5-hydroxy-6-metoxy-1,4-benzoquinol methylase
LGDIHTRDETSVLNGGYDRFADRYAELIRNRDEGTFSPYHDLVVPRLLELTGEVTDRTILDAGCGGGYVARILARRGACVTAIDVSPRLIELARSKEPVTKIEYATHDLSTPLPQYARRFDLIVSNLVLNDVHNYVGYANTLGMVTKSEGRLLLSMNNPYSAVIRDKVADYLDSDQPIPYQGLASRGIHVLFYHRTLEQYIAAFRDAGFLLRTLSDVGPAPETDHVQTFPRRYYHFPFFTILEFIRQ